MLFQISRNFWGCCFVVVVEFLESETEEMVSSGSFSRPVVFGDVWCWALGGSGIDCVSKTETPPGLSFGLSGWESGRWSGRFEEELGGWEGSGSFGATRSNRGTWGEGEHFKESNG